MTILEILHKIKQTNSRLEKEKIIIENDSNLLRKIFKYVYEPLKVFYIQDISESLRIFNGKNLQIENIENELFDLLDKLSSRVYTGNVARNKILEICNNISIETFELIQSILKKNLNIGIAEKTIKKIYGNNFITDFQIQLANKYDSNKNYKNDIWFVTPKLDGLRGVMNGGVLLSRNGKYLHGFEHIEYELRLLQNKYGIGIFDGEMYSRNIPFQKIQSIVMSQKTIEFKNKIKYYIFAIDLLNKRLKNTEMMYKLMLDIQERNEFENIVFMEAVRVKNNEHDINKITQTYIDFGYEGSILRNPENYISTGRNDFLLKNKFMKECDLRIVDVVEGKNKYENKMGSLLCEGIVEGKRISTDVGSGFTDEEREKIFENKDEYINKVITVKYQNLTDSGNSLRFPVKIQFKKDR